VLCVVAGVGAAPHRLGLVQSHGDEHVEKQLLSGLLFEYNKLFVNL